MTDESREFHLAVTNEVLTAAAKGIFGTRGRPWTVMEQLTCEGQALRALRAAWDVSGGWN